MKKTFSRPQIICAVIAGLAVGVLCMVGIYAYEFGGFDSFAASRKFSAVYNAIDKKYVGDANMEDISDAGYGAMVYATGDEWSAYLNAEEYSRLKEYSQNSYSGIGVSIEADSVGGLYKIVTVSEDSPASRAGVQIGESLLSVGGTSVKGKTAEEIRDLIAAQKSDFSLGLQAEDGTQRTVNISTAVIVTKPVNYELLDSGIGYVRIKNFEAGAGDETIAAVDDLVKRGAKGIVFDVRNDPGGMLTELLKALDHILPAGDIFVSRDENGNESVETSDANCVKLPMAVLIDENTYSAAEFFAAALSEYNWAKTVGTHTTGKSRSQINIELGDGSAVHLSTCGYLTPHRVDLAAQGGLAPQVQAALSESDEALLDSGKLGHASDTQLQTAISTVENEIKG